MQFFLDVILLLVIIGTSMLTGAYFATRGFEKGLLSLIDHMKNDDPEQTPGIEEVHNHDTK
jgi:hypothetical protein